MITILKLVLIRLKAALFLLLSAPPIILMIMLLAFLLLEFQILFIPSEHVYDPLQRLTIRILLVTTTTLAIVLLL